MVSYYLPCHQGASPWTAGRRPHQATINSLIQREDLSPWKVGVRALIIQQNPVRCRNQGEEGNTTHQTGKNPGSNSGLPQEAEREIEHLPMRHPRNCLFGVKLCLSVQRAGWKNCAV
jgi:hypothetical protein